MTHPPRMVKASIKAPAQASSDSLSVLPDRGRTAALEHLSFTLTAADGATHIRCACPQWFRALSADQAWDAFDAHADEIAGGGVVIE